MILEYGDIITKEILLEVVSIEDIKDGSTVITEENINLARIRFQVDGNTALHFYALDYNTLSVILNHMEYYKPQYLSSILMKNNKGKSPLDMSIDGESPRNTELFLQKIALFKDASFSNLFYDRFSELLDMKIKAFYDYLDSCHFQTIQMKEIKTLKLKSDADPWLVTHSSCLIDEVFVEKYCTTSERKALEIEKKKKEEEDKIKAEEDKKKEEQKKKLEEEKKGAGIQEDVKQEEEEQKNSVMDKDSENELIIDSEEDVEKPKTKEEIEKEKERQKLKRLDIRAIEFDWIFNDKDGITFLRTLASYDNIDIFSLKIIRYIIRFLWSHYRTYLLIYLFVPYLVYLAIFLVYVTYIHKKKDEKNQSYDEGFGIANTIAVILCLLFNTYFAYFEIRQIIYHKFNYFISFWNVVDLITLMFGFTI